MLERVPRRLRSWIGAALGADGARANVAADLADVHARLLEVEALANRLARIAAVPTTSVSGGRPRRAA